MSSTVILDREGPFEPGASLPWPEGRPIGKLTVEAWIDSPLAAVRIACTISSRRMLLEM